MNDRIVILYSGGADSRLMLEFAKLMKKEIILLSIDYNQLHSQELIFVNKICKQEKLKHVKVKLDVPVNSALTGDGKKNMSGLVHEFHVPGRNSMFLSIAFSIAESNNCDSIWIGCDWSDRLHLFPDCYQEYLVKINELFKVAGPFEIKVEAPLLGLSKENVLSLLQNAKIDDKEFFSGYGNL